MLAGVACSCLLSPDRAFAQGASDENRTRIGIGAVFTQQTEESLSFPEGPAAPTVLVTIDRPSWPRIEPEFTFIRSSQEVNFGEVDPDPNDPFGGFQQQAEATLTRLRVGVGVLPRHQRESFTLYYGGRIGYLRSSAQAGPEQQEDLQEEATNGLFVGPVIGGEYYPVRWLSVGGEVQFVYSHLSSTATVGEGIFSFEADVSESLWATRALFAVRFFVR